MVHRISKWLEQLSRGWVVMASLGVLILFTVLVLPRQSEEAATYSGDIGSPDLSLFYSPDDLLKMAEFYGAEGREAYIQARFTFDLIWPIVYTLFLTTSITWLFTRVFPPGSWWQRANLLPLLGMIFDYLENISTALVMWRFPMQAPIFDTLAPIFTSLKWILITGSFLLLLIGIVLGTWQWLKDHFG